ncbi:MAG: DAK2 domain-containing protein [Candidatus Omnitrophica bacterium]|nr:DAK2 domain-containing protein [Candidatus Omnitrophota bacterium]
MAILYCGGKRLKRAIIAGAESVNAHKNYLNSLNVFPVPDGDTGINMSLTLMATIKEVEKLPSLALKSVAEASAWGSLIGARGNSGVIMAQIFAGFAESIGDSSRLYSKCLARSFKIASDKAYKAVIDPVEGTLLTVVRETAESAIEIAKEEDDIIELLGAMVNRAKISLENTPKLLPALKEAGVIDAGGLGFVYFLEGMLKLIRGESIEEEDILSKAVLASEYKCSWRGCYCTECMIKGDDIPQEKIREKLNLMGDSLLIVGTDKLLRIHIHTDNPNAVFDYVSTFGAVSAKKIDDMRRQHRNIIDGSDKTVSLVVVALGDGIANIFKSLNVEEIVQGGQTMNPPVGDVLRAIENAPGSSVILLPNNGTITSVAHQAANLSSKNVRVVDSKTIPEGVSAVLSFREEDSLEKNIISMQEAINRTKSGEVTFASRDTQYKGMDIVEGDMLGIYNKTIQFVSKSPEETIIGLLERMVSDTDEVITIFYGKEIDAEEIDELANQMEKRFSHKEVEIHFGGQPYSLYIVSVE